MTRSWTLVIDTLGRPTPTNRADKMHWRKRSADRQLWRDHTATLARAQRIPRLDSITVTACAYYPDGRWHCDPDNLAHVVKGAIDGLVLAGVIADDKAPHIAGVTKLPPRVDGVGRAALVVVVTEAEPEAAA